MKPFYERPIYAWTCTAIIVAIFLVSWLLVTAASASEQQPTRVWGLYGYGDNWRGTSAGIDDIANQARTIPNVEFVHVYNYWETQRVADEIFASPEGTRIAIYGYSCGANAVTVIAHGVAPQRKIDAVLGLQESLWCGGNDIAPGVVYAQETYGDCGQTLGLGCKQFEPASGFTGQILNIHRPERHGPADNDPQYQQDILDAIYETANPPVTEPPPEDPIWHLFGHGHALARAGFANMLKGAVMVKKGVALITCDHNNEC